MFFCLFFLIIDLYLLILVTIAQNFNPTAEHVIPKRMLTKEEAAIETQPVKAEAKISKCYVSVQVF